MKIYKSPKENKRLAEVYTRMHLLGVSDDPDDMILALDKEIKGCREAIEWLRNDNERLMNDNETLMEDNKKLMNEIRAMREDMPKVSAEELKEILQTVVWATRSYADTLDEMTNALSRRELED